MSKMDAEIREMSQSIGKILRERSETMSTAESCTGGNIAASITAIPGSSDYFKGSIIAYSNEIKIKLLHVEETTLQKHGAVSEETVIEMAKGAMESLNTDCAVTTSGIAGPGGGTEVKPVGTVWIAATYKNRTLTQKLEKDNGREKNIRNATKNALLLLYKLLLIE